MVKVLLERTIRGKHVGEVVRLMRQMRVLAMQQPGYISGETLHAVDDPNHYLVISAWESLEYWQDWVNHPEKKWVAWVLGFIYILAIICCILGVVLG